LQNAAGKEIKWEYIERKQRTGGMVIIPQLVPSNRYVLIKQYRPAIDGWVLAFPAGLIEGEDLVTQALRELQEETGYYGQVLEISPALKSNAALFNDEIRVVKVTIDENAPRNRNPRQALDEAEEIEVLLIPCDQIKDFLKQAANKGYAIGVGLWFVFGVN